MLNVLKVNNRATAREFLEFPARLYQGDAHYIRPLNQDIEEIFDAGKNKMFRSGDAQRFLFQNAKKETVGKVAVFISELYETGKKIGGLGFFDCVNDRKTANFIFEHCKSWLQQRGMEAMDGAINFGERDKFWGVLVDGYQPPLYGMNYNFPYYKDLFENFGFRSYYDQLCYSRPVHAEVSRIFELMHTRYAARPNITAKPLTKDDLPAFAKDFTSIYNAAWESHGDGKKLEEDKVLKMFQKMKPVINEHISWFVYDDGRPIAMWINIPDMNQWFRFLDGKFGIFQKLKFLWLKKTVPNKKMVGVVFGVVPDWQKKGIEGYMICEGTRHLRRHTDFEVTEMQWIGDFNPKMVKIAENLDTTVTRRLSTYRYWFDRNRIFERHPIV